MRELVARIRAKGPHHGRRRHHHVRATRTPARAGRRDGDQRRKAINEFIRTGGLFDAVADFDAATLDPATGSLKAEFQPNSSIGGAGDLLHPNRAGYQAMGNAIDLKIFAR